METHQRRAAKLYDDIVEQTSKNNPPVYVSFGDDGTTFYVRYADDRQFWVAGDLFTSQLRNAFDESGALEQVEFAPNGGWWMRASSGDTRWEGLQNDLHEELNAQSGRSALSVKVGNCGQLRCGWFVRRYDSSWRYQGVPLKVHDKISEAKKGEGRLLEIMLGKGEDYFVEWLK